MWKILNSSHTNVHTIAFVLGSVSIIGYLVAFLRDRTFAHYFGTGELLDVYVASFRIPDLLFITATAFFSIFALLPMFEEKRKAGQVLFSEFVNTIWFTLLICLILGGVALFFLIPLLAELLFSRFTGETESIFIFASRILILQASLFTIASFLTTLLQMKKKFFVYALMPVLYNLGIILGVMVFYPLLGIFGSLLGVLIGVCMGTALQAYVLIRNGLFPRLEPTKRMMREIGAAVRLSLPRASALLSTNIAQLVIFGSIVGITSGALSVYYFADNLKAVPLVIVGTAYSVASFPLLVEYFTEGDFKRARIVIEQAFRRLFFFILPLITFVFVLRQAIVELVFETGRFTAEAAVITGTIVGIFVFSALSTSVLILCARALYACGKSLLPFLVFFTLALAEIFAVKAVVQFLEAHREPLKALLEVTGLTSGGFGILFAVVATIVALESIAAIALFILLARVIKQDCITIFCSLWKNATAAVLLGFCIWLIETLFFSEVVYSSLQGMAVLALLGITGMGIWYVLIRALRIEEVEVAHRLFGKIKRMVWK